MTLSAPPVTAADQKAFYDVHGYIAFPEMLDPSEVDVLQAGTAELLDEASRLPDDVDMTEKFSFTRSETGERHVRRIFNPIAHHQVFQDLAVHPRILDAVESLIGPSIQLHHSKLNLKPPASRQARFEWHQDYPFFPHTNYDLVAVVVHIHESTEENGCLRVIPESHKFGPQEHVFSADGAFSSQIKDQTIIPDESRWLSVTSPAGGVEMHHCNMLHSSRANRGSSPRSAVILQYRAADNVQLSHYSPAQPGYGMQVRGVNPYRARLLDGSIVLLPTKHPSGTPRNVTADRRVGSVSMIGTSRSRHEDGGVVHPRPPSIPAFEEALTDGSFATDPYPWHEVLRTQAPLYYSATLGQWLATSYDLVEEVLLSIDKFSSFGFDSELVARLPDDTIELAPTLAHHYSVRGLVQSDPPEHTRMRRAVRSYFSAQAVRRLEDRISANARRLLESVPDDFDLVRDFAAPLPISMIADLIGVPESEREGFPRWSAEMIQFSGSIRADPEIALRLDRSLIEFRGLLSRLFEERRADPRDDFLSLVTTLVSDGTLTSDEAMFMCVHLLNAGHETTTGLNESEPTVRLARPQRA